MMVSWYLLSPFLIPLSTQRGERYPVHISFVTTPQGGQSSNSQNLWHPCCMRSQSHERLWPSLLKLKFDDGSLTSKCCGNRWKKFNSGFQFQFQEFQFQFHFQFHQFQFQSNSGIGIGIELQFRNWNWIDPNPGVSFYHDGVFGCCRMWRWWINRTRFHCSWVPGKGGCVPDCLVWGPIICETYQKCPQSYDSGREFCSYGEYQK